MTLWCLLLHLLLIWVLVGRAQAQTCFDVGDCLDTNGGGASLDATDNDTDQIPDILVLICTQSFTAEALVDDVLIDALLENLPSHSSVDVKLVDEAGLDWTEESYYQSSHKNTQSEIDTDEEEPALLLSHHARMILFVASTYGDGDPPNHALQFADWLQSTTTSTSTTKINDLIPYAVFHQHLTARYPLLGRLRSSR